jgi:hypothetical protein
MGTTVAASTASLDRAMEMLGDQSGRSLRELSDERPTLVCLLRHNGCTFCRETISELAERRDAIAGAGLNIAVVGMSDGEGSLRTLGERFGLTGVSWFVDPDKALYGALGVGRGSFWQLLGPRVVWAGIRGVLRGYGVGRVQGDPYQMPGTVVIHRRKVVRQYVHQTAADKPDFEKLVCDLGA